MRRAKKTKESKANGGDRLSDLPDSILHHIFSFIDTRYAVRASVLSSRWRRVWKSLPHLYFDWNTRQRKKIIGDLVNKVLILRDSKSDIQSFRLHSVSPRDFPHVYSWVLAAIGRNVRVIDMDLCVKDPIELPRSMFSYRSLTTLKLSSRYPYPDLILPDSMSLSNLKVLHLEALALVDLKAISELISSCQSLESLSLESLELLSVELDLVDSFVINAPKLESLVIHDMYWGQRSDLEKCKIKVSAPNLRAFSCKDDMSREYSLGELCFLDSASIDMEIDNEYDYKPLKALDLSEDEKGEYVQRMTRLLEAVRNVKSLTLSAWWLVVIFESPVVLESLYLQFHNLKYLKLDTWLSRDCVLAIMHLLNVSPQIEIVSIQITTNVSSWRPLNWDEKMLTSANMGECSELGLSKQCMFHHLKVVEIRGVIGCVNELKLLQIVLKNAMVLEKMLIWTLEDKMPSDREIGLINFRKTLLTNPRASSNVAISFF